MCILEKLKALLREKKVGPVFDALTHGLCPK